MTAPLVERVTMDGLHSERDQLLERIGMSEECLLGGGEDWTLETESQWRAYSRLQTIRFLLGEDD